MSSQLINQVVELTNVERAKEGLKPLTLNNLLTQAAQGHSDSMAVDDFFAHTGADGSDVGERVQDTGYEFARAGENIAAGQTTAEQVVEGWMNSPGHRANILNADYTEIGIGYEVLENDTGSVNYNYYWTQVFGTPLNGATQASNEQPAPTIEENNDPIIAEDNSSDILEPEIEDTVKVETEKDSTPQESLQPENAPEKDSKVPQIDELIETEASPATEIKNDSQVETLDSNATDLESPKQNNDSLGKDFDFSLFGESIGDLTGTEVDNYSDDLTGSSSNLAMTGGDDAMISNSKGVYSFSSSSSISGNDFTSVDGNYDLANVADILKDSWLGTSELSLNDYESDLIENISNSNLSPSQQQKAIAAVESFF